MKLYPGDRQAGDGRRWGDTMIFDAGSGAAREVVMVLALAVAGLLLAVVAAFTPWYGAPAERQGPVVEMRAPEGAAPAGGQLTAQAE